MSQIGEEVGNRKIRGNKTPMDTSSFRNEEANQQNKKGATSSQKDEKANGEKQPQLVEMGKPNGATRFEEDGGSSKNDDKSEANQKNVVEPRPTGGRGRRSWIPSKQKKKEELQPQSTSRSALQKERREQKWPDQRRRLNGAVPSNKSNRESDSRVGDKDEKRSAPKWPHSKWGSNSKEHQNGGQKEGDKHPSNRSDPKQRRRRERNESSGAKEANGLVGSFIGIVVEAPSEMCATIGFLVYDFKTRKFTHKVHVLYDAKIFPVSSIGMWLRLILHQRINLEIFAANIELSIEIPTKAIICQRRVKTQVREGIVHFYTQAEHRKEHRKRTGSPPKNEHCYSCRFGTLKLSREELFHGEPFTEEDELPQRLMLWCTPSGQDGSGHFGTPSGWEVTKIEERIWVTVVSEAEQTKEEEKEEEEEAKENNGSEKESTAEQAEKLANDLRTCKIRDEEEEPPEKVALSPGYSAWFSESIRLFFEGRRLGEERKRQIGTFLEELRDQLRTVLALPEMELELFGSVNSGFGHAGSDLDVCIKTGLDKAGFRVRKKLLAQLVTFLRREAKTFRDVTSVLDARTPIVKFVHSPSEFHVDISMENPLAIYNTELLRLYTQFDARVAPLGFAIKRWATLCNINDASSGSVSSYAYIIMLIAFLQRCEPPILPFLQEEERDASLPTEPVEGWHVSFAKNIDQLKPSFKNTQSLADLFYGFLHYYAYTFDPAIDVAQIRMREIYGKKERKMRIKWRLCAEDPFDLDHNLTSGVSGDVLDHIRKCLRATLKGMQRFDQEHFGDKQTHPPPMQFDQFVAQFKTRRVVVVTKKKPKPKKEKKQGENEENGKKVEENEKVKNKNGQKSDGERANGDGAEAVEELSQAASG